MGCLLFLFSLKNARDCEGRNGFGSIDSLKNTQKLLLPPAPKSMPAPGSGCLWVVG